MMTIDFTFHFGYRTKISPIVMVVVVCFDSDENDDENKIVVSIYMFIQNDHFQHFFKQNQK